MSQQLPHSYVLRGQPVTISVCRKGKAHVSQSTGPLYNVTLDHVAEEVRTEFGFDNTSEDAWQSPKGDIFLEIREV